MKNKYYKLTAILNTYNGKKVPSLLPRSLDSILNQQFNQTWECIVVNDGKPNKEIVDIVEQYDSKFKEKNIPLTFFGTEEESGYQCKPKNIAIYHAKGEYISFLDYDNEWTPNHLQVLYDSIVEGDVWPDFTYGRREYVIDKDCSKEITLPNNKKINLQEGKSPLREWNMENVMSLGQSSTHNFVDTSDFLTSKGAFWWLQEKTGMMWNEGMRRFGDWELITRAAFYCGWRGKAVDEVVSKYYWTGSNLQLTRSVKETPEGEVI